MTCNEKQYWAERENREGEIHVVCRGNFHEALAKGSAVQFYEMNYMTAVARLSKEYPEADLWYTERNGDPITMLVPKGTDTNKLPSVAMDYLAFEWIKHDSEFGTGVRVSRRRRPMAGM